MFVHVQNRKRATGRSPRRPAATVNVHVINGIRRLDRGLRVAAREVQRATGLSAAQLFVLEQLLRWPGASLNELAALTMTDRSSVSAVVDRLFAAGLVTRQPSKQDRRRAEVRITPAGRRVLDRAPPAPTDLLLRALRRLPETSLRRLGRDLAQLNHALGFRDAAMLFTDVAD